MKHLFTLFFLSMSIILVAQEDSYHTNLKATLQNTYNVSGGTWVLTPNEANNATYMNVGGGTKTVINVSGQSFTKATQIAIASRPNNPWNASMQLTTVQSIEAGDCLVLVFWARTISATNNIGKSNILFMLNGSPYTKYMSFEQRFGTTWKRYMIPFTAPVDIAVGVGKFMAEMGFAAQTMQVAGVNVVNFKQQYALSSLPTESNDEYAGMESTASWRNDANTRINQYRKADLQVNVTNNSGVAVPNATVIIEMLQHEYAFGTAIDQTKIAGGSNLDETYQAKLMNLDGNGHGFSEIVFENGHKWASWEGNWGGTKEVKAATVGWLADRGIRTRGHAVVWPGWGNSPSDLQNLSIAALKTRIYDHTQSVLTYPNMGDLINEWDLINEFTGNVDIANKLKGTPGYPTGREIYVDIFNKAKQANPNVKRYLNEAHFTNLYVKEDLFRSYVQEMVNAGVDDINIGFQCHFRFMIPPVEWYNNLTTYSDLTGGFVKITEYDNKTRAPKWLEAQYFKDLLTITFSHPKSDGFLMWGFWDGAHFADRAPLFDINWNLKQEGQPFIDLVFGDWWTNETVSTNTSGNSTVRGFKGQYKITVTRDNKTVIDTVSLSEDLSLAYQLDVAVSSNNIVTNPTFDTNTSNWAVSSGNGAASTIASVTKTGYSGKACKTTITNAGASSWDIQLRQNIPVTAGKTYTLTFKASADAARAIAVMYQMNTSPWTTWKTFSGINLTTTPTTFGPFTFDCSTTDATNLLKFMLGGNAANVYIDDVVITESAQLILNPTFDINTTNWVLSLGNGAAATIASVTKTGYSGKACKTTISNAGSSSWDIQLRQNIPVTTGKTYTLTFKASADVARAIAVTYQMNTSPWTRWKTFSGINLTTTPTTFGPYTFDCSTTDATNLLKFMLGGNTENVYIDDVSITESTTKSAIIASPVTKISGETLSSKVTMYPNPASNVLNIQVTTTMADKATVNVIDLQGRVISSTRHLAAMGGVNHLEINTQFLDSGTYIVNVTTSEFTKSKMIVIKR
ncbi:MAG: carbohydrate binding domain-containing protein [Prolixibacteraceae bacterium]|jgi:endo-1,4-beta-xylanase|nr:carbohydrate binding domain-containing protein [Prolixibacteraceae bacterium]